MTLVGLRGVFVGRSAILWVCVVLASSANAGSWEGQELVKDEVRHVMNPADGIEPPMTIRLDEQWRIGEEDGEDGVIFGLIRGLTVDEDGYVYVMDYQLSEVRMFSPNGEFVRTIARSGEGPGELRRPDGICVSPKGLICVAIGYPSRIVQITTMGDPATTIMLPEDDTGSTPIIYDLALADDYIVIRGGIHDSRYLSAIDSLGNEVTRYYEETHYFDEERPVWEEESRAMEQRWGVGTDGRVYIASSFHDYKINVHDPSGEVDFVIEREYEHRRRSAEEKQFVHDWATVNPNALLPDTKFEIENYDKDVMALYCRDDGTCWVLTSRGFYDRPVGSLGVFDVFDEEGRFIRQATLLGEGDPFRDRYYFYGDRLYVVSCFAGAMATMVGGGEKENKFSSMCTDPMSVVCFEITR